MLHGSDLKNTLSRSSESSIFCSNFFGRVWLSKCTTSMIQNTRLEWLVYTFVSYITSTTVQIFKRWSCWSAYFSICYIYFDNHSIVLNKFLQHDCIVLDIFFQLRHAFYWGYKCHLMRFRWRTSCSAFTHNLRLIWIFNSLTFPLSRLTGNWIFRLSFQSLIESRAMLFGTWNNGCCLSRNKGGNLMRYNPMNYLNQMYHWLRIFSCEGIRAFYRVPFRYLAKHQWWSHPDGF